MKPYYEDSHCKIYHGDCLAVMEGLADDSIDVIWTDPPYGHSNADGDLLSRRAEAVGDGISTRQTPIANDTQTDMRRVVEGMLKQASRILKRDCCCCCCSGGGGPTPTFAWLAQRMDAEGLEFFHSVIWDKKNPGMGWRFRRQHEMVMVAHRRGGKLKWREDRPAIANIISICPGRERLHPNEKPIEVIARFLFQMVEADDVVLDPFMGSGSTLVASKNLGCKSIGIEIEEKYCEVAAKRLSQEVLRLGA